MTTTYDEHHNPWRVDGSLRKRLDDENESRQLANSAIDLLGVVAVHAGRDWESAHKQPAFPGRALISKNSDPMLAMSREQRERAHQRRIRLEQQRHNNDSGESDMEYYQQQQQQQQQQEQEYYDQQQQQQQQDYEYQQQQQHQRRHHHHGEDPFQYAGMSELDNLHRDVDEQQLHPPPPPPPPQQQRRAGATPPPHHRGGSPLHQNPQHQNRHRSPPRGTRGVYPHRSPQQIPTDELTALQEQRERDAEEEAAVAEQYGLQLRNSRRDLRRARQCKYGVGHDGKRGGGGGGVVAPAPLDPRRYPVQPAHFSSAHAHPLAVADGHRGDFVRVGESLASFPGARAREIHQNLEERRAGKSSALKKAIDEIKYHDRALLVQVPYYLSNHKSRQVEFLGGGNRNVQVTDRMFLANNCL